MKHNLTISCSKDNLAVVRHFIEELLERYHVSDVESYKIVLAVDEVCANLIIHANNCNAKEFLELLVDVNPHKSIEFTIRDRGVGFDINNYKEPKLKEIVSSKRKGGLGLMLVKRIMDEIEFSKEKNHNICRLVKKLS